MNPKSTFARKVAQAAAALKSAPLTPIKANRHARPVNVQWAIEGQNRRIASGR